MKIEYRIANRGSENWAHVRYKKFLFWSKWKKIAKHPTGYGMYPLPDFDYPKTILACREMIIDFNEWFKMDRLSRGSKSAIKYINFKI